MFAEPLFYARRSNKSYIIGYKSIGNVMKKGKKIYQITQKIAKYVSKMYLYYVIMVSSWTGDWIFTVKFAKIIIF